jgi:hypothetical protein
VLSKNWEIISEYVFLGVLIFSPEKENKAGNGKL